MDLVDLVYGKALALPESGMFAIVKTGRKIEFTFARHCFMSIVADGKWCIRVNIEGDNVIRCDQVDVSELLARIYQNNPWLRDAQGYFDHRMREVLYLYDRIVTEYSNKAPCAFSMLPPKIGAKIPVTYIGSDYVSSARMDYDALETSARKIDTAERIGPLVNMLPQPIAEEIAPHLTYDGNDRISNAYFDRMMARRNELNESPDRITREQFIAHAEALRAEVKLRYPTVPFEPYWSDRGPVVDGWGGVITFDAVESYLKAR